MIGNLDFITSLNFNNNIKSSYIFYILIEYIET